MKRVLVLLTFLLSPAAILAGESDSFDELITRYDSRPCQECHPDHVREWSGSMHAYAMVDPVFRALVRVRQREFDGAQDPFCLQCHSATLGTDPTLVPEPVPAPETNIHGNAITEII